VFCFKSIAKLTSNFFNALFEPCCCITFWSTTVSNSKSKNKSLNRLAGRYKDAMYKTASGFGLIADCVKI
jgi:hypothetical protein